MNPMKNVGEVSSSNIDPELLNLRSVCHVEKNMCSKFQVPTPTRIWHLAVLGSTWQSESGSILLADSRGPRECRLVLQAV